MNNDTASTDDRNRDSSLAGHITIGVLHEFNNVLQGIIGLAEMLDADPSIPHKAKIITKAIRRLGQNASQMVQSFGESDRSPDDAADSVAAATAAVVTKPVNDHKLSILVVEDDALVLSVVTGMLKHLGYSTVDATDGEEGFRILNDNADKIGLVITDMVMPRLGGLELAKRILESRPGTKIVVMTGYLQDENRIDPDEFGLEAWLEKPMTADRLRLVVDPLMQKKQGDVS